MNKKKMDKSTNGPINSPVPSICWLLGYGCHQIGLLLSRGCQWLSGQTLYVTERGKKSKIKSVKPLKKFSSHFSKSPSANFWGEPTGQCECGEPPSESSQVRDWHSKIPLVEQILGVWEEVRSGTGEQRAKGRGEVRTERRESQTWDSIRALKTTLTPEMPQKISSQWQKKIDFENITLATLWGRARWMGGTSHT